MTAPVPVTNIRTLRDQGTAKLRMASRRLPIAARRTAVDQLYLHGDAIREIADVLGVSPTTISRDVRAIASAWQRHPLRNWRIQNGIEVDCEPPVKRASIGV